MLNINDFVTNEFNEFKNIVVVNEDFFESPFNVFKSSNEIGYITNWPYGKRTVEFPSTKKLQKKLVESIPFLYTGNNSDEFELTGVSGSFLKTMNGCNGTWNHVDISSKEEHNHNMWAAVVYMHPFPYIDCGTCINGYINTQHDSNFYNIDNYDTMIKDKNDTNRWFNHIVIGNSFNKYVLYTGSSFHTLKGHFGHNIFNCRNNNTYFIQYKNKNDN